jgi:hypothetical protein
MQRDTVRVFSLAAIQKTMVGCARARSAGRWHVSVGGAVSEKGHSTAEQLVAREMVKRNSGEEV